MSFIAKAHELAAALGGVTEVALLGRTDLAGQLGGADVVVAVDHPALSEYLPEAYEQALLEVLAQRSPRLLLMSNGTIGLDLRGRALGALGGAAGDLCQRTTDRWRRRDRHCTDPRRQSTRRCRAVRRERGIATVLGGAFGAEAQPSSRDADVVHLAPPAGLGRAAHVTSTGLRGRWGRPRHQASADMLVSVGRGIESQDNMGIVEELAGRAWRPLSASRPVVDAGWLPKTRQVGQSS